MDREKQIADVLEFKRLFTQEHLKALEKVCDVWRKAITNDALIEQFALGKRAVYIAIKDKMETDITEFQKYLDSASEDDR